MGGKGAPAPPAHLCVCGKSPAMFQAAWCATAHGPFADACAGLGPGEVMHGRGLAPPPPPLLHWMQGSVGDGVVDGWLLHLPPPGLWSPLPVMGCDGGWAGPGSGGDRGAWAGQSMAMLLGGVCCKDDSDAVKVD